MDMERGHVTEKILNLTLETVYLLTGENYMAFKISDGLVTSSDIKTQTQSNKNIQEGSSEMADLLTGENCITFKISQGLVASNLKKTQSPVTKSPSPSLEPSDKKVQDVIREIIELLTGEDGHCLEGHKSLYKDAMMENCPPLALPDGPHSGNPPERCPSPPCSQVSEQQRTPQDDQVMPSPKQTDCRMEAKEKTDDLHVRNDEPCKEEELPPDIIPGPENAKETKKDVKAEEEEEIQVVIKEEEIPIDISTESGDTRDTQRDVKAEEEEEGYVGIKEEELTTEINADGNHSMNNLERDQVPLENSTTPTLLLVLTSGDCTSDPSMHGFPNPSAPVVHHPSARGGETFRCPECGECFSKRELLISHKNAHTKSESDKGHPRKLYVIEHEMIPMKPYSCSECGKCFTQKGHVVLHQRTHTGEKPYSCSECGKGFPAKSALSKHKRMHTGEKPFSCSDCGKCFSFNSALTKHKKTHTGEKPYSCSDCGRCFSQRDHLIAHQKTHTGEKPFSCSECGKSFAKKGNLETHQTIHTGDRPYSCSVCGKGFRSKSNLLRHKKVHRGLKPHACSECGKQFKTEFTLSLHLRSHEPTGFTLIGCGK